MDVKTLKQRACKVIDEHRDELIALGEIIRVNPELGYKEYKTVEQVKKMIDKIGLPYESEIAMTGIIAQMPGRSHKVRLAIMGELDAVVCPEHPQADPVTGAAHACGHFAQIVATFGAAMGLKYSEAYKELDGDIEFWATPAEEAVEIEWRQSLINQGKISFLGGKQEMIKLGCLDNIDLAMMIHSSSGDNCIIAGTSTGFVAKFVKYTGKEAHAGGAPHMGINALNAAEIGLMAIHAQRETFRDEDTIRVHPIITKGGDLVNVVPADVRIETYVRGKTMAGVLDASKKVNRALEAGAMAVGAKVEIKEIPGYMPRMNDKMMNDTFEANLVELVGKDHIAHMGHNTGSSDFGDIMHLVPAIHPYIGGSVGGAHSSEYQVANPELMYIVAAKSMAMTAIDLLANGAEKALEVVKNYTPVYKNKEEYLAAWQQLMK
ncbi:MAG: amidohydrolase [Clostridiaceae bacterium]|nr:amidohydrolase [Clostridiaceae bacterium]